MTAQFHEGQEVEVLQYREEQIGVWRKAKIVREFAEMPERYKEAYLVQFPDGTRAVFDAAHIRAIEPTEEYSGLAEQDDDTSEPMGSATYGSVNNPRGWP